MSCHVRVLKMRRVQLATVCTTHEGVDRCIYVVCCVVRKQYYTILTSRDHSLLQYRMTTL
jgi:hypothetical protein